ncbi:unnamed protein product [Peniophora sp. CBMAI 1063]|nr:unnamed protein product [Peniophora sp. CBMAI 1063]
MSSPFNTSSPRGSRASTPIIVNDYDYVPQEFDDMLYQMQTDRACMPYSTPSDQLLLSQSEAGTIELMLESGRFTNARTVIETLFERNGIPSHGIAQMPYPIANEAELGASRASTPNHNTIVLPDDATVDQPPHYARARSHSVTPSLYSDADASSPSTSGIATPADIFSRPLDEYEIEEEIEEEQERVVAPVVAGSSGSRKRSRTVDDDDDLDFEPHIAPKPQPRKRTRVARRAAADSDAEFSDSDSDARPAPRKPKRTGGRAAPVICRCPHDKCQNDAGFSSVRVYERHYRSVHLGVAKDVQCGGCGLTFESGRKDSVLRHQGKNNQRQCLGKPILVADESRRVPVPRAIML